MRTSRSVNIKDGNFLRSALLAWGNRFDDVVWLESNGHREEYSEFDALLAVDAFTALQTGVQGGFDRLKEYQENTRDWIFGALSYDLKNDLERLSSNNTDGLDFPGLYFFQPKKLLILRNGVLELHYLNLVAQEMEADLRAITNWRDKAEAPRATDLKIRSRLSRPEYLARVGKLLDHIRRGDIYEANYCQELFAESVKIDPVGVYRALNLRSTPPFACFSRLAEFSLISASPERYLRKKGSGLTSQPIKGTAARSPDPEEDQKLAWHLSQDPKERSENIMIVDLVRNDLSRVAQKGSVKVRELCGIYSFQQVHQMISTVTAVARPGLSPVDIIRECFPMGSMTGAPKVSAMEIIEKLEASKRGLYSGAMGYFTPEGDFDFSVIIRSILYNASREYLSFSVGSAITSGSQPEKEYEECLIKARAMREVLEKSSCET